MLARLLDRHHRLLRLAAVAVCVVFGIRAALDVMDAFDSTSAWAAETPRRPDLTPGAALASAAAGSGPTAASAEGGLAVRSAGAALVDRNIFCSGCATTAAAPAPIAADRSGVPPATTLPLRLIATHVASSPASRSSATVLDDPTANQGAYRVGEELPGAGAIVRIGGRSIDFENPAAGRVERLTMSQPAKPAAPAEPTAADAAAEPPPRRGRGTADPELAAALAAGVRAIDETTFEVERGLIEGVIARPQSAARGARVSMRDGGLRLSGVRPDSAHARLGLKSGDTVLAVNGVELSSPDKMLEAVTRLRTESSVSLSVLRRNQPVTLTYRIR